MQLYCLNSLHLSSSPISYICFPYIYLLIYFSFLFSFKCGLLVGWSYLRAQLVILVDSFYSQQSEFFYLLWTIPFHWLYCLRQLSITHLTNSTPNSPQHYTYTLATIFLSLMLICWLTSIHWNRDRFYLP